MATRLVLSRRGRLLRTLLVTAAVLLLAVPLVVALTSSEPDPALVGPTGTALPSAPAADPETTATTAAADVEMVAPSEELHRSGTVGPGTWTAAGASSAGQATMVHTYALRVEDGIGIDVQEAADEVERILADERGWGPVEDVAFTRVADPAAAEFTISLASPTTTDELCLPARTESTWSCRNDGDVVLNSDRWLYMTPTYTDLREYRAYMVNHEVGHFLGHGHPSCPGEGEPAPVMLQQSIDLDGCTPNPWPTVAA